MAACSACSCSSSSSCYLVLLPALPRNGFASSIPRTYPPLSFSRFQFPARIKGGLLGRHHLQLLGKLSDGRETSKKIGNLGTRDRNGSGFCSVGSGCEGDGRKTGTLRGRRTEKKDSEFGSAGVVVDVRKDAKKDSLKVLVRKMVRKRSERGFSGNGRVGMAGGSSLRQGKEGSLKLGSKRENPGGRGSDDDDGVEKVRDSKRSRKSKVKTPGMELRAVLDTCSKIGDFMGAIRAYDSARKEGVELGQYHYTVVLYLCASAATGVVRPAKSGTGTRTLNGLELSDNILAVESANVGDSRVSGTGSSKYNVSLSKDAGEITDAAEKKTGCSSGADLDSHCTFGGNGNTYERPSILQDLDDFSDHRSTTEDLVNSVNGAVKQEKQMVLLDEDDKKYALERGLEIYKNMCLDKIPMNEAALTSVARMAMSIDDGDMAFSMVKEMISLGINPKLRSYGPALSAFSNCGDINKAFEVEKHLLDHGIEPEEPELRALLRVSIAAGNSEKAYYVLHKLRTNARKVTLDTANLIEKWFSGPIASILGKNEWDVNEIKEATEYGGGGWHGKGWLGKGKWNVSRTTIDSDGLCRCCWEKLALIDLDPVETENFAQSVASIAIKREKNSFEKFRKWLDYHGPFEAIIDGANVGLFSQNRFIPSKINMVANGIRQKLPSKRWPLIVLHNKRVVGGKMDEPVNKTMVEKWRNADALYATPTGSNDDWYWLYAAIKFKSLIVTNDEMRDHIFQILGNDFFPKWKERHQVRFSFSDTGPVFHMPPPCSVVIQESENGHWHIPISAEQEYEADRTWLCVRRAACLDSTSSQDVHSNQGLAPKHSKDCKNPDAAELSNEAQEDNVKEAHPEAYQELKNIAFASVLQRYCSLVSGLETAEALGNCIIDFQI